MARLYLDQILPGTLEELGVNLGKILANQNLARQSWLFIQDTSKNLGNIFSRDRLVSSGQFVDTAVTFVTKMMRSMQILIANQLFKNSRWRTTHLP